MLSGSNRAAGIAAIVAATCSARDAWDRASTVQRMSIALSRSRKLLDEPLASSSAASLKDSDLLEWGAVATGAARTAVTHGLGSHLNRASASSSGTTSCRVSFRLLAREGMGLELTAELVEEPKMTSGVELAQNRRIPGHGAACFLDSPLTLPPAQASSFVIN